MSPAATRYIGAMRRSYGIGLVMRSLSRSMRAVVHYVVLVLVLLLETTEQQIGRQILRLELTIPPDTFASLKRLQKVRNAKLQLGTELIKLLFDIFNRLAECRFQTQDVLPARRRIFFHCCAKALTDSIVFDTAVIQETNKERCV